MRKLYLLLPILLCFYSSTNSLLAQEIQQIFTICPGETVFFPAPPNFASEGAIEMIDCPSSDAEIIRKSNRATLPYSAGGFSFQPEQGKHVIITRAFCRISTATGSRIEQRETEYYYEVRFKEDCAIDNAPIFSEFPWLNELVNPNDCSVESIEVFQSGTYKFLLFKRRDFDQTLYFQDGTPYCRPAPAYDCLAAYGLANPITTWNCGDNRTQQENGCSITISNTQCRVIDVFDNTFRRLTRLESGPFGNSPFGTPTPEWTDPTPLADNESRTYIFKEGDFTLTRKTVTCAQPAITTANAFASGCNDGLSLGIYTNTGCRAMTVVNTNSELVGLLTPDNSLTLTATNEIYIFLIGTDTIAVKSDVGGDIDSGGCGTTEFVPPIFEAYPWLSSKVSPTCTEGSVLVYQSGVYNFLFVRAAGKGILYFEDGTFYCENAIGLDCVSAYQLGAPIDSWSCGEIAECICPTVVDPVCGVNGLTYNNTCEAACAGVAIAFNTSCNIDPPSQCAITISNTQCKPMGIFDDAGNQLTIMTAASLGEVIMEVIPTWTDPSPLSSGESRTYILKDGLLEVARKTVTCDQPNINTNNPYAPSCNDALEIGNYTNSGCQTLTVYNPQGEVLGEIAPNGIFGPITTTNNIYIFLAGTDTIAIKSEEEGAIDSGGCDGTTGNAIPADFREYNVILRVCKGESISIPNPSVYTSCPPPTNCPGPCEPGESFEDARWSGGPVSISNSTVTFSPSQTTIYTGRFRGVSCSRGPGLPAGPAGPEPPRYSYLVIVEDSPNCLTSNQTAFEIEACIGDLVTIPIPNHIDGCSGVMPNNNIGIIRDLQQNYATIEITGSGTFSFFLGENSVRAGGGIFPLVSTSCPTTTYDYTVRIKSNCTTPPVSNVIFTDFPWLQTKVNPTNCSTESVALYQQGVYQYLLITDAQGQATLYNQDGLFYCQNAPNFDCVSAYNFGSAIATWTCGGTPPPVVTTCDLLSRINFNPNLCEQCLTDISVYSYQGKAYLVYTPQNVYCNDFPLRVVDCDTGADFCFAGGIAGIDECGDFFSEATHVETILEEDCTEDKGSNCTTTTGTIFLRICNGVNYYLVETEDGRLFDPYLAPSINYEFLDGQKVHFDYIDAGFASPCSLAEQAITITCIEIGNNPTANGDCGRNLGEISFNNCDDGTSYFFLQHAETGELFDIYFAAGISFTPKNNQEVRFDYVPAHFESPCSLPNQAVIITCIEEVGNEEDITNGIFPAYPFLYDLIDVPNCERVRIEVFEQGAYSYIFIGSRTEPDVLYFEDGTFYCQNSTNYDCREVYGLSNRTNSWTCSNFQESESEERNSRSALMEGFSVYPNPTVGNLVINIPPIDNKQQLQIFDLLGRVVQQIEVPITATPTMIEMDISKEQNGIYYVQLRSTSGSVVQKIIKQDLE